jgi:hypothetical protein
MQKKLATNERHLFKLTKMGVNDPTKYNHYVWFYVVISSLFFILPSNLGLA